MATRVSPVAANARNVKCLTVATAASPETPTHHAFIECLQCYVRNNNLWYSTDNHCECPRQCRVTKYEQKLSTATFPNEFATQFYTSQPNWPFNSTTSIRRNVAKLTIYCETLTSEEIYEQPLVNQWQLFSTVGGLMGLFIGCSTMTLFEVPDFLIVFLRKKLRNRHVNVKDNVTVIEIPKPTTLVPYSPAQAPRSA